MKLRLVIKTNNFDMLNNFVLKCVIHICDVCIYVAEGINLDVDKPRWKYVCYGCTMGTFHNSVPEHTLRW